MEDFGAYLKREREAREVSLDDVVRATRISRRFLEALEEGRVEDLPELTFVRGFLRAYAEAVGLDGNALVLRYESEAMSAGRRIGRAPGSTRRALAIGAAVALVASASAALIWLDRREPGRERVLAPAAPQTVPRRPERPEPVDLEPPEPAAEPAAGSAAPPAPRPLPAAPAAPSLPDLEPEPAAPAPSEEERERDPLADLVGLDGDGGGASAP